MSETSIQYDLQFYKKSKLNKHEFTQYRIK